jgi:hypothetical protein
VKKQQNTGLDASPCYKAGRTDNQCIYKSPKRKKTTGCKEDKKNSLQEPYQPA